MVDQITAWTTVVLAAITGWYAWVTHRTLKEVRAAKEPAVFLDIEIHDGSDLFLLVGNSGATPARDIRLDVLGELPWLDMRHRGLKKIPAIQHGVPYLAPGRTLRFRAGSLRWDQIAKTGGWLNILVEYDTVTKGRVSTAASFDLGKYIGAATETFESPERTAATALAQLADIEQTRELNRIAPPFRPQTKPCPFCSRRIPASAHKCPECLEWMPALGPHQQ